jgi:hypothetical protein
MEQYNQALSDAADAENSGDEAAAAQFDSEAARIYALILEANEDEAEIIE